MKVPNTEKGLLSFARDTIESCTWSQATRAQEAASNLSYYEIGSDTEQASLYNRTGLHVDRLASYLYAPGEVRYSVGFDMTDGEPWIARARAASKYLSREYRRADADLLFFQGVSTGIIKGCSILKHNWMDDGGLTGGFDPHLVHPEFFGVEREDLGRLEDQGAMVHTTYLTKDQVKQMVDGRQDEAEVLAALKTLGGRQDEPVRQNWLHQIVISGVKPVTQDTPSGTVGQVSMSPSGRTNLAPDMLASLLRLDELWVVDSDRRDYTTIQLLEGSVLLEGKYRHRNLTGVKGLHPFTKICPMPVSGYFWGRSEVERVKLLQDLLSDHMMDIQKLLKLRVKPPKGLIGFSGMTQKKLRAALAPGGFLQEQSPGAKIENLIPNIPQELFTEIYAIVEIFDETGGFKPIMQGQGEPGVRANAHARTLMRTGSPGLREKALQVERDAEASADTTLKLMQAKEASVFVSDKKEKFILKQLPEDWYVEVDSHSSSPAFIDDERELAFALEKAGAAGPVEVIMLTHPPQQQMLLEAARERAAAQQKMIQEHPELLEGKKKARA